MRKVKYYLLVLIVSLCFCNIHVQAKTYYYDTGKSETLTGTVKKHKSRAANGSNYTGYHLELSKKIKVGSSDFNGTEKVKKLTILTSQLPSDFKIKKYVGKKVKIKGAVMCSQSGWYCCPYAIDAKKVTKVKKKTKK